MNIGYQLPGNELSETLVAENNYHFMANDFAGWWGTHPSGPSAPMVLAGHTLVAAFSWWLGCTGRGNVVSLIRIQAVGAVGWGVSCMWPLQQSGLDFFTWPLSFTRVHEMMQTLLRHRPGSHRALLLPHSVGQSKSRTQPDSGVGKNGSPLLMGKVAKSYCTKV